MHSFTARAHAAASATSPLAPANIQRRKPMAKDVVIVVLYCGLCHSDIHQVREERKALMPTAWTRVERHRVCAFGSSTPCWGAMRRTVCCVSGLWKVATSTSH